MLLTLLAFGGAILFLGIAVFLVSRHWKEICLLDPMSIKEEQQRQKREALIFSRFERMRSERAQPLLQFGRFIKRSTSNAYRGAYERVHKLETFYNTMKSPFAAMAPNTRDRIKELLAEGRALSRDLKWADAERRFLEILSLDQRHAEAYKGLGQIYLRQKLYPQAKETFEFLVKLRQQDDGTYSALAEIAEAEGDMAIAEQMRLKAVEQGSRQAHRHAELAEFYLRQNAEAKAWPSAKRASDLEPKSAKYLELSLELALKTNDAVESRRRYNRLRLLSDDQGKIQHWRERVEEIERQKSRAKS
ncbi:MAG: hypothetical protein WCV84_03895 [Patescibacteria group bacterium]